MPNLMDILPGGLVGVLCALLWLGLTVAEADEAEIAWVEAQTLTVEGKGWTDPKPRAWCARRYGT